MNNAPLISVIIPIYNSEQYLRKCIDSVLNQTFADFELLLIDDGSIDNSRKICNDYEAKDSRVKVITKTNGGVSLARNIGIKNAQGEWMTFIDSDDCIVNKMLESLIPRSNYDLVVGGIKTSDNRMYQLNAIELVDKIEISNDVNFLLKSVLFKSPCGKLYHRDIIQKYSIHFDSTVKYGEDMLFNLTYLKYCNSIKIISECFYLYYCQKMNIDVCDKYNLTIQEIQNIINLIYKQISQLEKILQCKISIDYLSEFMSKYSINDILNNDNEYFGLYKIYGFDNSKQSFYNNVSISPIFRGIAEIKECYENGHIQEGKALMKKLYSYISKRNLVCRFPYKDFQLWHYLIKNKMLGITHCLLLIYSFLKNK